MRRRSFHLLRGLAMAAAMLVVGLWSVWPAAAQVFESRAQHAYLIDYETNTALFDKDGEVRMPPASMAKLMTMAVVFDLLKSGRLKLTDTFVVSENAWRSGGATSGGSTMFAQLNSEITVDDLMHGIVIQSGNDACIVMAEGVAGTEAAFAQMMNEEAARIGLTGSHFVNATGLPDPDQYVTARDLAVLARHIIRDFPEYYPLYSQTEFTWNKIRQHNRNPLLEMNIGADGLKTGFTEESGYGLVGSAVREGQRLILVINGTKSMAERADEARKLMDWGFRAFERVEFFGKGDVLGEASVFHGAKGSVGLVAKEPIDVLLPRGTRDKIKGRIIYQGPLVAPVEAGQEVGILKLTADDRPLREAKVYAAEDVETGTLTQRAGDAVKELLLGWW